MSPAPRQIGIHCKCNGVEAAWTDCRDAVEAVLLVAHTPGMTNVMLPSVAELNHLRHMANLAASQLLLFDQRFIDSYVATLGPEQARVVRSMVVSGPASMRRYGRQRVERTPIELGATASGSA